MDASEKAVLETAQEGAPGVPITLASGVRVRLRPVASGLMENVLSRIVDPPIPKQLIGDKGREEPNPFDPTYLKAVEEANRMRTKATLDAVVLMAFDLVDGVPPDKEWMPKLNLLATMGHLDLSAYDLKNPLIREFVFKRFIAVSSDEISLAMNSGRIRQEVIDQSVRTFRSETARATDPAKRDPQSA